MNTVRKRKDFFFAESGIGMRQSAFNVPMDNADIDVLSPLTEPTAPSRERTRETVYDCDNVHIIREPITAQFDRWTISYTGTAQQIAKRLAFAKGAAAAPTGTPQDEVQSLVIGGATALGYTLTFAFEGLTGTTPSLLFSATAAQVQAALEELDLIGDGNVTVAGSVGGPFTITFINKLAKANLPLLTVTDSTTGGTGVVVTQTTAGGNKYHLITRAASDVLPEFTFFTGFDGDAATYLRHKNAVIASVTATITRRALATVQVEIIASSDTELDPTFIVPPCVINEPVRAGDCRMQEDGDWITEDIQQIVYELNNNVLTDDNLFPFAGIDIIAPERGEQFTETIRIQIQGSETDDIYKDADQELEKPVVLYIGVPGERVVITMPLVSLKLDGGITFNSAGKSVISITGQPHKDPTLETYSKVEYFGAQTAAFLTT